MAFSERRATLMDGVDDEQTWSMVLTLIGLSTTRMAAAARRPKDRCEGPWPLRYTLASRRNVQKLMRRSANSMNAAARRTVRLFR